MTKIAKESGGDPIRLTRRTLLRSAAVAGANVALGGTAPARVDALGGARMESAIVGGRQIHVPTSVAVPDLSAEQADRFADAVRGGALTEDRRPIEPRTHTMASTPTAPELDLTLPGSYPSQPRSSKDFSVWQSIIIPDPPVGPRASVSEPSVAQHGDTILICGGWFAAVSLDGGQTWRFLDAGGIDPLFLGDQGVIYSPAYDLWIWVFETSWDRTINNNRIHILVANSVAMQEASIPWFDYVYTAQTLGSPDHTRLDYPNIALSDNYFWYSVNAKGGTRIGKTTRHPLAALAAHESYTVRAFSDGFSQVPTHGATTMMYLAYEYSGTQTRLVTWPESADAPTDVRLVTHAAYVPFAEGAGGLHCVAPNGTNVCAADDTGVKTAWIANGVLGVLWDAPQGVSDLGVFPYPYIQGFRVHADTMTLIDEPYFYSSQAAVAYPGAAVNARGAVGINAFFGGGASFPSSFVLIGDEFSTGPFGFDTHVTRIGKDAPSATTTSVWGDFLTARKDGDLGKSFVGIGFTLQGPCEGTSADCGANLELRYMRWGREGDNPFAAPPLADPPVPSSSMPTASPAGTQVGGGSVLPASGSMRGVREEPQLPLAVLGSAMVAIGVQLRRRAD